MRRLSFFLLFVFSFHAFGQTYVSDQGQPVLDGANLLLEGGRVIIVPYEPPPPPQYDVGVNFNAGLNIPPNDDQLNAQRQLSLSHYNPPRLDQAGQDVFRGSLAQLFNGGIQRNQDQIDDIMDRRSAAASHDSLSRAAPLNFNSLADYSGEVDDYLKDSSAMAARTIEQMQKIQKIKRSDYEQTKKRALMNLARVKMDREIYEGELAQKFNVARSKYWQVEEEDFKSDKAFEFLDMGTTSYQSAKKSYKSGDVKEAGEMLELSNTFLDIALGSTPFVGMFKDAYEAYSGKNLIDDRPLSSSERTLAVVGFGAGLLTGGTLGGAVKQLPRLLPFAKEAVEAGLKFLRPVQKHGVPNRAQIESLKQNSSYQTVKRLFKVLDEGAVELADKKSLARSFDLSTIEGKVLKKDLVVYRWHNKNDKASELGRFVSEDLITDRNAAKSLLALPKENEMLYLQRYKIRAGTEVFSGKVAPFNGHPGGGSQVFITGRVKQNLIPFEEVL